MNIIDYRDIYDRLKDKTAKYYTRELEMFFILAKWKKNDRRNQDNENHN